MRSSLVLILAYVGGSHASRPTSANCTEHFLEQPVDHFTYSPVTEKYNQRYFVCPQYKTSANSPIFFYTGNEADVTLFVNNTGLMWELAQSVGAVLVFGEHRYYGSSVLPAVNGDCMRFLTVNQVLSDYAHLIVHVRSQLQLSASAAVVTFGSSYGGMLSGWMRMKYPHLVEGAVASSAPIFHPFGISPDPTGSDFAITVSKLMGDTCSRKLKQTLRIISHGDDGKKLRNILNICEDDQGDLARWASTPWGFLAMGNYPYANAYIPTTAGVGSDPLPPNPLNAACAILTRSSDESATGLVQSLNEAVQMWYNASGTETCFRTAAADPKAGVYKQKCYGDYSFQRCAELAGPYQHGTYMDAFWPPLVVDKESLEKQCRDTYGMSPRIGAAAIEFGDSVADTVAGMSNIIWSNGEFDPWRPYGVNCNAVDCPASVFSPFIRGGAHSSDLMFSHPLDSGDLEEVRRVEYAHISSWIEAKTLRYAGVRPQNPRPSGAFPRVVLAY